MGLKPSDWAKIDKSRRIGINELRIKVHKKMDCKTVGKRKGLYRKTLRCSMEEEDFIKEYKQEYRTILAVLQKVGLDYIRSGHLEGNTIQHLEYVLRSVRESCEKNICKVCNKRQKEEKKKQKEKLKVVK
jgi:deoxyxylulose-5-phosphate synthase